MKKTLLIIPMVAFVVSFTHATVDTGAVTTGTTTTGTVSTGTIVDATGTVTTGTITTGAISTGTVSTGTITTGTTSTGVCSLVDFKAKRAELQAQKKANKDKISTMYKERAKIKDKTQKAAKLVEIKTLEKEIMTINKNIAFSYKDEVKAKIALNACKKAQKKAAEVQKNKKK